MYFCFARIQENRTFLSVQSDISSLLQLQERDTLVSDLESQLKHIPLEVSKLKKRIAELKQEIADGDLSLKQIEVDRSNLELEAKGFEEQIVKYKNQQLEVKKNEEYQAMTQQIEGLHEKIAESEERILELMLKSDDQKVSYATEREKLSGRVNIFDKEAQQLQEREIKLKGQIKEAIELASACESDVSKDFLQPYQRVRRMKLRFPIVVILEDNRCKGCHIRVSQEVVSGAYDTKKPAHCDSCNRIVYAS